MHRGIYSSRRDGIHANALLRVFLRQAPCYSLKASFCDHRDRRILPSNGVIYECGCDIDNASASLLSQHLLDCDLTHEEETFDVDGNERSQIVNRVFCKWLCAKYTRIVDEHINRSELACGDVCNLRRCCTLGYVSVNQREGGGRLECSRLGDV